MKEELCQTKQQLVETNEELGQTETKLPSVDVLEHVLWQLTPEGYFVLSQKVHVQT
jgi:hypothetical protein